MKKISIAFDVDGTLRSNQKPYELGDTLEVIPNDRIVRLLMILSTFKNVTCHIWSGQGKKYAEDMRIKLSVQRYIKLSNCHGKDDGFKPDIAIDDMHSCDLGCFNLICNEK